MARYKTSPKAGYKARRKKSHETRGTWTKAQDRPLYGQAVRQVAAQSSKPRDSTRRTRRREVIPQVTKPTPTARHSTKHTARCSDLTSQITKQVLRQGIAQDTTRRRQVASQVTKPAASRAPSNKTKSPRSGIAQGTRQGVRRQAMRQVASNRPVVRLAKGCVDRHYFFSPRYITSKTRELVMCFCRCV